MSITSKPCSTSRSAAGPKSVRVGAHQLAADGMLFVGDVQKVAVALRRGLSSMTNLSSITSHSVYGAPSRRAISRIGMSL